MDKEITPPVPLLASDSSELILSEENRSSMLWWMAKYFSEYATGKARTLKYKAQDLKQFFEWFIGVLGYDNISKWNRAVSNQYLHYLTSEKLTADYGAKRKGDPRWANRSINRKIDHLKGFARWITSQVTPPLEDNPTDNIKRLDVPVLEAKRLSEEVLDSLTSAAENLSQFERRADNKRFKKGHGPLKKTARPLRDQAIFALLKGSGLRVQALCNLNLSQVNGRRINKVKEKGSQERNVVISKEAVLAMEHYIETEREEDAVFWQDSNALFLSIPQTRLRNPNAQGRLNPATVWRIIRKISSLALGEQK
jgi:site-specific recombinase XerD